MSIENPRFPQRTFSADEGQRSKGTAGPDQIEYDFDNLFAMLDPSKTLRDGSPGGIGSENMQTMSIDHSQSPVSNQGRIEQLLGRLANRIRAIMGSTDWKSDPEITLSAVKKAIDGQAGSIKRINNVQPNETGDFSVEAGTGITVSAGQNKIVITATGIAAPGPHASAHAADGADPISPASIGAATAADIDAHKSDASAHHARYTDAEAVAAVKAADGAGSGFDADLLDGKHGSEYATIQQLNELLPRGVIVMWSGSVYNIPPGWYLCNGQNGTPDLRDRFIVGAGSSYAVGDTGGAAQVTLTVDQIPAHEHTYTNYHTNGGGVIFNGSVLDKSMSYTAKTSSVGGGQPHENRPPYYALCFIMKG